MPGSRLTPPVDADDHREGSLEAPLVLVEYGDFQCSLCRRAFPVVDRLRAELGERLCFVFRNFPLATAHPLARFAASVAEAAARQGKYWEMHALLFERQPDLSESSVLRWAGELGLKIADFNQDISDPGIYHRVNRDFLSGARSGVNGTPTFFINGARYDGLAEYEPLRDALLAGLAARNSGGLKPGRR